MGRLLGQSAIHLTKMSNRDDQDESLLIVDVAQMR